MFGCFLVMGQEKVTNIDIKTVKLLSAFAF